MFTTDVGNVAFFSVVSHSFYQYSPFYAVSIVKLLNSKIVFPSKEAYKEEMPPGNSLLQDSNFIYGILKFLFSMIKR